MFEKLTIHGEVASLLWGYRTAATLSAWKITKDKEHAWTLTATVQKLDAFQARQRPLLFTAPHEKGRWCWMVEQIQITDRQVTATLGQPVQ
jgi:hypothetical protein